MTELSGPTSVSPARTTAVTVEGVAADVAVAALTVVDVVVDVVAVVTVVDVAAQGAASLPTEVDSEQPPARRSLSRMVTIDGWPS